MTDADLITEALRRGGYVGPTLGEAMASARAETVYPAPSLDVSEAKFQAAVIAYAKARWWLVYHTHLSKRCEPGFPDLVLIRQRIVWAELKTETGKLTKAQTEWRDSIKLADGEWYLWRPSDWAQVQEVLK